MKRCVITGAAGMLGSALIPQLKEAGYQVYPTDLLEEPNIGFLDVRDYGSVKSYFNKVKPNVVFHLAAETDLEKCELDPDHAFTTNALGTQNVCLATRNIQGTMVYISTAGVFDGTKEGFYTEFDQPNPINVYGKAKYEGEKFVERLMHCYFIIRAGWMVGGGAKDKKFTAKIIRQLRDGARKLFVVNDKLGTPTYNVYFSRVITMLSKTEYYGLYHAACSGSGSRLDVAKEILTYLGRTDVELVPVTSDFFKELYPAPRPRSEMMVNYLLGLRGMNIMGPWREALVEYLNKNYQDIGKAIK